MPSLSQAGTTTDGVQVHSQPKLSYPVLRLGLGNVRQPTVSPTQAVSIEMKADESSTRTTM